MSEDLIRYDVLAQEALRGVVRRVLIDAGKEGLPGEHHFFIAFDTRHPGVRISDRLREKHPEEMTIVLQHQFWDLNVTETTFEVGLSFGNVPERLLVPFEALKGFFDPSVQFGLQFEVQGVEAATKEALESTDKGGTVSSLPALAQTRDLTPVGKNDSAEKTAEDTPEDEGDEEAGGSAEVVSLDAFRKKN
ncbi:MAG: ClpXP protease specificity-enhancing factor SspB [Pseudomonadota bacterium]